MSWIRNMFNNFSDSVKSTVVEKKVTEAIDGIDDDGVVALMDIFGESMHKVAVRLGIAGTKAIKDNSVKIAELCGRNADTIIAFKKAVDSLSNDLNCDANKQLIREILKTATETFTEQMTKAEEEIDKNSEAVENIINDIAESVGVDLKTPRYFIFIVDKNGESTGEYSEVKKSRYMLRQVSNKETKYNGSYYSTKVGNKIYESTPENFNKKH